MLTIDAWIIRRIFQPIVDTLVHWRTHFGLAKLCMYGASGCMLVGGCLLVFTSLWWSAAFYAIGAWTWALNGKAYDALEELEARGFALPPSLLVVYMRVMHVMVLLILLVTTGCFAPLFGMISIPALWMMSTTIGWAFATSAHYFAGCQPGTPRRQFSVRWQPA